MKNRLVDYDPQLEGAEVFTERAGQGGSAGSSVLSDGLGSWAVAAELLEAEDERALERTLRGLLERIQGADGRRLEPALSGALLDMSRRIAGPVLLPVSSRALGALPGPLPARVALPQIAAARAERFFGLELEGLTPEDKEFELAMSFVRLVSHAARHALQRRRGIPPATLARDAFVRAARKYAPGLFCQRRPRQRFRERHHVRTLTTTRTTKDTTMHDIDRSRLEYSQELFGSQGEQYEFGQGEWSPEAGGTFNESEETELAHELLGVNNEAELDRFLGDLVSRATRAVGSFVRSPVGQAVGGVLKGVAKKALPLAAGAIGGHFGGPLGAKIGTGLANAASDALGLEGELAQEDREVAGARQFVRLAGQTAASAAAAPQNGDPKAVAQQAAVAAAKQFAPGLLGASNGSAARTGSGSSSPASRYQGRWMRRGNKIVLYGA
jgi:hypothetical protein